MQGEKRSGSSFVLFVFVAVALPLVLCRAAMGQCEPGWVPGGSLPGVSGSVGALTMWDRGAGPPVLVVGGAFNFAGRVVANNIAVWDGEEWSELGGGTDGWINVVLALPGGDLVAAGAFNNAGSVAADGIARWDGSEWFALGSAPGRVTALAALPNGTLVAGWSGSTSGSVRRWDGQDWVPLGDGPNRPINALAVLNNGDLIAGGEFWQTATGLQVNRIARWDGSEWHALGAGMDDDVHALLALPNGDLLAGGAFTTAGGLPAQQLARWDGSGWSAVGPGFGREVRALALLPGGDVLAGGRRTVSGQSPGYPIQRWDGIALTPLGTEANADSWVTALAVSESGTVFANSAWWRFSNGGVGRSIAQWDGTRWSPLGTGISAVIRKLAVLSSGDVVAGGEFSVFGREGAHRIARWDGEEWFEIGGGIGWNELGGRPDTVLDVAELPDGRLVAGGRFARAGSVSVANLASWDGTAWSDVGNGVDVGVDPAVRALAVHDGDLIVTGGFWTAGGTDVHHLARWDGTQWHQSGGGLSRTGWSLMIGGSGDLIVGGEFTHAGGLPSPPSGTVVNGLARYDGSEWSSFGSGMSGSPNVRALAVLPSGDLVAGGRFWEAGGVSARNIARWDGTQWHAMVSATSQPGTSGQVYALAVLPSGDLVVGGAFFAVGFVPVRGIARWDGSDWFPMGSGVELHPTSSYYEAFVRTLAVLPNGDLLAGGNFMLAGGHSSPYFARWRSCEPQPCYADCDGNGVLNIDDFMCYINEFSVASGLPAAQQVGHYANCDGSTGVPVLTIDDFLCFINAFSVGCW